MIIIANRIVPVAGIKLKLGINSVPIDHKHPAVIDQLRIFRKMDAISFTESLPGDTVETDEKGAPILDEKGNVQINLCHCCSDSQYAKDAAKNSARNDKRRKSIKAEIKKFKALPDAEKKKIIMARLKKAGFDGFKQNNPTA